MIQREDGAFQSGKIGGLCAALVFLLLSCQTSQKVEPEIVEELPPPMYEEGVIHGKEVALGSEKDYTLVRYIYENVKGDTEREAGFSQGFVDGYSQAKQESEPTIEIESALDEGKKRVSLGMAAASSPEYDHGLELAQKVKHGTISDIAARGALIAPKSLVDQFAVKSGFIAGYEDGGAALYFGLIR